jgi:hypothetical protein
MNAVWQETGLQEGEWNIFFRGKKLHVTKGERSVRCGARLRQRCRVKRPDFFRR